MAASAFPEGLFGVLDPDDERSRVVEELVLADPHGKRSARVFRDTFDQLYDGQRTGRYRWDQLYKTEKTHFGTLLEINLRREFDGVIGDGEVLDYLISGVEVDCKYSQSSGSWMLPPECFGRLLLVAHANDAAGVWSLGVVRASLSNRREAVNRDGKTSLNRRGRSQVEWIRFEAALPPNVLLSLDLDTVAAIVQPRSGQARIVELLRRVTNRRIGRNTIATVGQQVDYMARIRDNGNGARTRLRREGYLVIGGDYMAHTDVARALGCAVPEPGEVVSVRVVPALSREHWAVELDGGWWRLAAADEVCSVAAPWLPSISSPRGTREIGPNQQS
ncbi:MAG: NaeI family type II restriction endonuclease [Candidatus Nanopelagicales bacterium]